MASTRPEQNLVERRNSLSCKLGTEPGARIQLLQFSERVVSDKPASVGRAIDLFVVNDGQCAIARKVHI